MVGLGLGVLGGNACLRCWEGSGTVAVLIKPQAGRAGRGGRLRSLCVGFGVRLEWVGGEARFGAEGVFPRFGAPLVTCKIFD